jgi:hypothetical protein
MDVQNGRAVTSPGLAGGTAQRKADRDELVALMARRCPVCGGFVRHHFREEVALLGTRRRCPVCKLVLVFDGPSNQMMVAPFDAADEQIRDRSENLEDIQSSPRPARR